MNTEKLRVLIADDHAIVRHGLKQILAETDDMEVAGEVSTGRDAIATARRGHWNVVLLDISMPDRDGLETLEQLKREHPKLNVLMLSMHREEQYALRALKSGASGYLNKQSAPDELVGAIRTVASGRKHISMGLAQELASRVGGGGESLPHEQLSNREFQTLCMIASGGTVSSIAKALSLSVKTVSMYRARMLEKMNLKNNAEATYYAIKHGLVE